MITSTRGPLIAFFAAAVLVSGFPATSIAAPDSGPSACAELGGAVAADDACEIHTTTSAYTISITFPMGYPDQQAVNDYVMRRRQDFLDWVSASATPARATHVELDILGRAYRSGDQQTGTRSVVLDIGSDTGVHPVATYKAFNYNLGNRAPVTFETLFKAGSNPVSVLNPVVRQALMNRDQAASVAAGDLTAAAYQQFAITDDAIVFFFNQDGLLPHEQGPFQVSVPRGQLASILA